MEAIPLSYPLKLGETYGSSRGLVHARQCTLIRLCTDGGWIGYGEAFGAPKVIVSLVEELKAHFLGLEPSEYPNRVTRLINQLYHTSSKGYLLCALSGIEMASWDAFGKQLNVPVYKLLGGRARTTFVPYASTGYMTEQRDLSELEDQVQEAKRLQFKAMKIKIGTGLEEDVRRVETVRKADEKMLLMVDINGNYTADQAIRTMERIKPYGIYWVEEPLPPYDFEGFRKIKRSGLNIPLAAGEAEYTRYGFKDLIQNGWVDIVQPDLSKCGGVYEAKAISMIAHANNVRVSPHIWGGVVGRAAAAHFMASIPYYPHALEEPEPMFFEFDLGKNALRDEIGSAPLKLENGILELLDAPGFGVTLDEEKIEFYKMTPP